MNKTVYLRDEEVAVWERARELSGDKLSPVIVSALRQYVLEKEARQKGFERLEIEFSDANCNGLPRKKAFYGRWIFPPNNPHRVGRENDDTVSYCGALATTAKGNVVTCTWTEDREGQSYKTFQVYTSFEKGVEDPETSWVVKWAIRKIGIPVEELDI